MKLVCTSRLTFEAETLWWTLAHRIERAATYDERTRLQTVLTKAGHRLDRRSGYTERLHHETNL